jgi:hypothetical protein
MNIKDAKRFLNNSKEEFLKDDFITAARIALRAQEISQRCRSKERPDVSFSAHMWIVAASVRIKKNSYSNQIKSEIGRILKSSLSLGWGV